MEQDPNYNFHKRQEIGAGKAMKAEGDPQTESHNLSLLVVSVSSSPRVVRNADS